MIVDRFLKAERKWYIVTIQNWILNYWMYCIQLDNCSIIWFSGIPTLRIYPFHLHHKQNLLCKKKASHPRICRIDWNSDTSGKSYLLSSLVLRSSWPYFCDAGFSTVVFYRNWILNCDKLLCIVWYNLSLLQWGESKDQWLDYFNTWTTLMYTLLYKHNW